MLTAKRITDNLIVISEISSDKDIIFCMQLVIGKNKAALIDAGLSKDYGLLSLIKEFTNLPVAVYLTHGHGDHIGNVELFDEIHIGADDKWMLNEGIRSIPLYDGEIIDLGETYLEAYAFSGHTDGAFCFLNKTDGYVLTGDIINRETWLCWEHCATVLQYAEKVLVFSKKLEEYQIDMILEGHSDEPISRTLCSDMINALMEISEESATTDIMHHIENGRIKNQHSYGKSKIIYDKRRYYKNEQKF